MIWEHRPLISLDTETGGLDPEDHDLLTFAGLHFRTGQEGYRSVKVSVSRAAYRVNKLDLDELRRYGQTPEDADGHVAAWIGGAFAQDGAELRLLGQHLPFDLGFIKAQFPATWQAMELGKLPRATLDTRVLAQAMRDTGHLPGEVGTSLSDLAQHYGITYEAHQAFADALTTAQVYDRMVRQLRGME